LSPNVDVFVEIDGAELTTAERVDLARQLQGELDALGRARVGSVETDQAPTHTKAGEALTVGALVVSLAPQAYAHLMQILSLWLERQRVGIKLTIDNQTLESTVTEEQRDALVEAFLARVTTKRRR